MSDQLILLLILIPKCIITLTVSKTSNMVLKNGFKKSLVYFITVLFLTLAVIAAIYALNTPAKESTRVNANVSLVQSMNSTERFVSNSVELSLSPQPPNPMYSSDGFYYRTPGKTQFSLIAYLQAESLATNGMIVSFINTTNGKVIQSHIASSVGVYGGSEITQFKGFYSTFYSGQVTMNTIATQLSLYTNISHINASPYLDIFQYEPAFFLNSSNLNKPVSTQFNLTAPADSGELTILPSNNTQSIVGLYYYNQTMNLNEMYTMRSSGSIIEIDYFSSAFFTVDSPYGCSMLVPINVIDKVSFNSNYPSFTNSTLVGLNVSTSSHSGSFKFTNSTLSIDSEGAMSIDSAHLTYNKSYEIGYLITTSNSFLSYGNSSLYATDEYWLNGQLRLLSGIVGGAIIGISPQIASVFARRTEKKGR